MKQANLKILKQDIELNIPEYHLINYLNLSKEDALNILRVRNNIAVRQRMVNSEIISEGDHLEFISNLANKNVGYWVLKKNEKILGSISLVDYNKSSESFVGGNFIVPELIGGGFGVVINFFMHSLAFEFVKCSKLKAIVKNDNKNALRVNKLYGAIILDSNVQNREYCSLEFLAENWFNDIKDNTRKLIEYVC